MRPISRCFTLSFLLVQRVLSLISHGCLNKFCGETGGDKAEQFSATFYILFRFRLGCGLVYKDVEKEGDCNESFRCIIERKKEIQFRNRYWCGLKENVLSSLYISFIGLGIGFRVREEVMEVFRKFLCVIGRGKSSRSLSMWIKRNIVIRIFFYFVVRIDLRRRLYLRREVFENFIVIKKIFFFRKIVKRNIFLTLYLFLFYFNGFKNVKNFKEISESNFMHYWKKCEILSIFI